MRRFVLPTCAVLALAGTAAFAQQVVPGAAALDRWDANHDGRVTLSEVRAGRASLFSGYDGNGDGMLSTAELSRAGPQGATGRNSRGMLRYALDRNGDGRLTRQEFVDGAAAWMQRMDSDGNGVLTTTDFGRNGRGVGRGAGAGRGGRWDNG